MDSLDLILDHWLIHRSDESHILNGKVEDFEEKLRELIRKELSDNG